MDALTKLNEYFLSCNICTEIFQDPCTIGCQHTFCKGCLTNFTKTRSDAIAAESILCPNCNQMTKVPRPEEPVDQWCHQFKPSFLIQGLLDTFTSKENSGPIEHTCFTCQQIGKTTQAKSVCEDCNIIFCKDCTIIHVSTPVVADHVISPLAVTSSQLKKSISTHAMCKEHNCLVEFCCLVCQKVVCSKCCIVYHRKCHSVVTLESLIPEMKHVLRQNYNEINSQLQQTENTLKSKRSEVEDITQHKSSLQSEINRVSQQAVGLIRRKQKTLLDELDIVIEEQTGELRRQIKSGENDLQTYQHFTEFIKQVLHSNGPMDLYDMYMMCQSGEITAEIKLKDKKGDTRKRVEFENQLDQIDLTVKLGNLIITDEKSNFEAMSSLQNEDEISSTVLCRTKSNPGSTTNLLSTVSIKSNDDTSVQDPWDIVVLTVDRAETLVVADIKNSSIKSCYEKEGKQYCTSLKLDQCPLTLTKISSDTVAVSHFNHNSIELIRLTPDPVLVSKIKTEKNYKSLTALTNATLAAGCKDYVNIDVIDMTGRVRKTVIIDLTFEKRILNPMHLCTTRQGHILVTDGRLDVLHCVTQKGKVLYTVNLTRGFSIACGGVITTDTGSVIVADYNGNKIVRLTEQGRDVRDLLTEEDGIVQPQGIRVHFGELFVSEHDSGCVKIFQI